MSSYISEKLLIPVVDQKLCYHMGMYSTLKSNLKADQGFCAACLSAAHSWDSMATGYSASLCPRPTPPSIYSSWTHTAEVKVKQSQSFTFLFFFISLLKINLRTNCNEHTTCLVTVNACSKWQSRAHFQFELTRYLKDRKENIADSDKISCMLPSRQGPNKDLISTRQEWVG